MSLPSRISLKKDWMKKILSRRAEAKNPGQNPVQQVPKAVTVNSEGGDDDNDHVNNEDELNGTQAQVEEDGLQIRIEKTESWSDKSKAGIEDRDIESKTSENDDDLEDMPILVEEIGNAREVQFETITFKKEVEDKVDSIENSIEESPPALEKQVNFIQFNEDSFDEDGPSEDPLMLGDGSRVSVQENESSELHVRTDSSTTVQGKIDEVKIVQNFIETTKHRMLAIGRTVCTSKQLTGNAMRVNANTKRSRTHHEEAYPVTGIENDTAIVFFHYTEKYNFYFM